MKAPDKPKTGTRVRKRALVIKVMAGGRGLVFSLSPVLLFLVGFAVVWAFQGYRQYRQNLTAEYQARIQELEQENRRIQTFLARKEREKRQMLALAEARSEELWDELQARDRQMDQIWKVVGKKPSSPANATNKTATHRHSLSGARNGLQVKRRYLELSSAVKGERTELGQLQKAALSYRREKIRQAELAALDATPSVWPCRGTLSSGFGYRVHPILGYGRFHSGVDVSAPYGQPIQATAAGRVVHADYFSGYGLTVVVDHGNGLQTLYGHCSSLGVGAGQFVKKGQTIAYVGSTGMSTGPHCHYEVSVRGTQVDPVPYLSRR